MNLIELLLFAALSAGLLAFGHFLSARWGTIGLLIGGVPVGLFWSFVLFGGIRSMFIQGRQSLSSRPTCRQGNCKPTDYVIVDSSPEKALFRCRCGDLYVSHDGRFQQLLPGGSLMPYMVRNASGDWNDDTAKA